MHFCRILQARFLRKALQYLWVKLCDTLNTPSSPGTLHLLFPLPGTPFPQSLHNQLRHSSYRSNVTSSKTSPDILLSYTVWTPPQFFPVYVFVVLTIPKIVLVIPKVSPTKTWASSAVFMAAFLVSGTVPAHSRCSINKRFVTDENWIELGLTFNANINSKMNSSSLQKLCDHLQVAGSLCSPYFLTLRVADNTEGWFCRT